jgi:hypothetical protein
MSEPAKPESAMEIPSPLYNTATVEKVIDWVRAHPLKDGRLIPVCVWGDRGVGKTQFIRGYCQRRRIGFRGYHPAHDNSGSDIIGLPYLDEAIQRTVYARPMWLPSENDAVSWDERGLIFIDEINRAPKAVLAGLMEPIGEGTLEKSGWHLPEGWGFICAANPPNEKYQVITLDEALMNRMIHVALGFDAIRWAAWAGGTDVSDDVVSFMARFPNMMAEAKPRLPDEIDVQATPRSLEYLARLYEPGMDRNLLRVLAHGLIGKVAGEAFIAHMENPDKPVIPEEVFTGRFQEKLGAHLTAGRRDLIDASQTMLVAMMSRYQLPPDAERAEQMVKPIVTYIQMLGVDHSEHFISQVRDQAPHWLAHLERALGRSLR